MADQQDIPHDWTAWDQEPLLPPVHDENSPDEFDVWVDRLSNRELRLPN